MATENKQPLSFAQSADAAEVPSAMMPPEAPAQTPEADEGRGKEEESRSDYTPEELLQVVLTSLDDDKAQDIVSIDLAGKTVFADFMVVASGRSQRHVGAMADHIMRAVKDAGMGKCRAEGLGTCDWVLLDAGDVIVHLFRPEVRDFYRLEKIWAVDVLPPTEDTASQEPGAPADAPADPDLNPATEPRD